MQSTNVEKDRKWVDRFLGMIERVGNLLPHPVTLFAYFALGTIILSGIGGYFEWSVPDPRPAEKQTEDGRIHVVSLLSDDGLRKISTGLVKNFTDFAPLGTVLVALLGVGLAEHSGLVSAAIRSLVFGVRREFVTVAIVFAGVLSNTASEIGYVVLVPLGAAVYYSLGRHPLAGLAAAYAGVSGGYSANLLLGTVDPLLAGITTPAANMYAPEAYEVSAAANWYFMVGSTFLVTIIGSWVSISIVEPRLGPYSNKLAEDGFLASPTLEQVSKLEQKGLWTAFGTFVFVCVILVYLCWPPMKSDDPAAGTQAEKAAIVAKQPPATDPQIESKETADQETGASDPQVSSEEDVDRDTSADNVPEAKDSTAGSSAKSAATRDEEVVKANGGLPFFGALGITQKGKNGPVFLDGVVAIIFVAFLLPGIAYGAVVGTVRSDKDIIDSMSKSMTSMGSYIVLVFFAAQFVKFFDQTNLGTLIAVLGADAIIAMKMDNAGVFILFIILCALVNLIMGSSSAKWAFMAPIFVPMLMRIGYSPELIQCAYRIGDSCTNVISPMMSYFGMIFVFASRYDKRFGMGSIISLMFPYSVVFLVTWIVFFYVWVFLLEWPIGPNAPIFYPATSP